MLKLYNILVTLMNRFIPTKKNRRLKNLHKSITSMLRTLIERKENMMSTGQTNEHDLLGLLLKPNNENRASNTNDTKMTMKEIIEECRHLYVAGHQTTSSLLTWTMVVVAMHPIWQDKAREEVLKVCGKNHPDAKTIGQLKTWSSYLDCFSVS